MFQHRAEINSLPDGSVRLDMSTLDIILIDDDFGWTYTSIWGSEGPLREYIPFAPYPIVLFLSQGMLQRFIQADSSDPSVCEFQQQTRVIHSMEGQRNVLTVEEFAKRLGLVVSGRLPHEIMQCLSASSVSPEALASMVLFPIQDSLNGSPHSHQFDEFWVRRRHRILGNLMDPHHVYEYGDFVTLRTHGETWLVPEHGLYQGQTDDVAGFVPQLASSPLCQVIPLEIQRGYALMPRHRIIPGTPMEAEVSGWMLTVERGEVGKPEDPWSFMRWGVGQLPSVQRRLPLDLSVAVHT